MRAGKRASERGAKTEKWWELRRVLFLDTETWL